MTSLPWLDPAELYFPSTDTALQEPNGLLAVGGDLNPKRLCHAYQKGIFPWYEEGEPILWWSPSPRAVLQPNKIHISKSLAKYIRKHDIQVTCDTRFEDVIHNCAHTERDGQPGTWITDDMIAAYIELHEQGIAHSIETWLDGELVGGLYGLGIGRIFFGESMYSHSTNASKIAFVGLAQNLQRWGYPLIDCQIDNKHLTSLGAENIDRKQFNGFLDKYTLEAGPQNWQQAWQDLDHETFAKTRKI